MKSKEIQKHIDRVVGTEGIFRIPSWWMHKILSDLVKYCEDNEGASSIKSYIESQLNLIGEEIDGLDERLKNVENHELFEIVSELPSESKDNTIYLIPSQNGEDNNVLTEWVYINDSWEKLGEFKVQLDEKLYAAYPVEAYEGPEQPERKVVELGGEKLYNCLGEISIPADMVEVEGTLPGDALIPTEYMWQPTYEGVLQPYFEYEQDLYLNLYIGNDKYGYTSLKIGPSEDPNNLKWFDAMGFGMFQEGSGSISFAYDVKNWTLHYKANSYVPCNIKVYCLYRAQKLDINLIPQEIARKEDLPTETKKIITDYDRTECTAYFLNVKPGNTYYYLQITSGELGAKTLNIFNYVEGRSISFQYEKEDETNFYYSSDIADISIRKKGGFSGHFNTTVHYYSLSNHKLICTIRYDEDNHSFDFSYVNRTLGEKVFDYYFGKKIRIYLEIDDDVTHIIDSAYCSFGESNICCAYLRNKYIEFKILISSETTEDQRLVHKLSLEIIKEIDISSLESRLEALEQKLNEITTND